jgi:hypothetical protein
MSVNSEAPSTLASQPPAAAAEHPSSVTWLQTAQPSEAYRSPLVDALIERLRQIHASRQMPH